MTTYGDLCQQALEALIAAGGTVGDIALCVHAYEYEPAVRAGFFEAWLEESVFRCLRCDVSFKADVTKVSEDDQVVCSRCRALTPDRLEGRS